MAGGKRSSHKILGVPKEGGKRGQDRLGFCLKFAGSDLRMKSQIRESKSVTVCLNCSDSTQRASRGWIRRTDFSHSATENDLSSWRGSIVGSISRSSLKAESPSGSRHGVSSQAASDSHAGETADSGEALCWRIEQEDVKTSGGFSR
jgi:hypothetical protein